LEKKLVAGNLFICGNEEAYYGVGVYDKELMEKNIPVSHYGIFHSILYAKKTGMKYVNMNKINITEDPKVNAISFFKRGFINEIRTSIYYEIKLN
jgi:lipid II:glycine glycyltransferase (peptidoglycan interpeptide bridge formation enzyme)